MAQNVYCLYDRVELKPNLFSAPVEALAKDAVMAFIEKKQEEFFSKKDSDEFKNLQTLISVSSSIEELKSALVGFDFDFAMMQVD